MMKQEFVNHVNAIRDAIRHETGEWLECLHAEDISAEDYAIIEYVYMYHPAIPEVGGKARIAKIWDIDGNGGGMSIIRDMQATAKMQEELERQRQKVREQIASEESRHQVTLAALRRTLEALG